MIALFRDRLNTAVLVFDYRGYGRSEGSLTEAGVLDGGADDAQRTAPFRDRVSVGWYLAKTGRWLTERDTKTGDEVFRVALPVEDCDPLPIEELVGYVLVQTHERPGGAGLTLFIDRAGDVWHRFDRQVVTARDCGGDDRLFLGSSD